MNTPELPISSEHPFISESARRDRILRRWSRNPKRWLTRLSAALFFLALAATIAGVQLADQFFNANLDVAVGEISAVEVRAPNSNTFTSELLTQQERERAAAAVANIYDPPENRVARRQITRAQAINDYINRVRLDPYADPVDQLAALTAIADFTMDAATASAVLALSDARWNVVSNEIVSTLDRAMRAEIREGEVAGAQRRVPSLVGFGLDDNETAIVSTFVRGLLRPNSFYNAERTEAARQEAAEGVKPVTRTITIGETILRAGDRIDALDMEALNALGLLQIERDWRDYASALILSILFAGAFTAFITVRNREFWADTQRTFMLGAILVGFIILAQFMAPSPTTLPYLLPLAAMTMLISVLIDLPIALVATLLLGWLIGIMTGGNVEIIIYTTMAAFVAALSLGRADRIGSFVRAGVWIILCNLAVLAAFRLPLLPALSNQSALQLASASTINGIFATSITLVVFYLLSQLFGITTSLQLLELSRPTHPLLRQLLLKAPGTYHHTLIVSNMVEEAASAIGADVLLARVGSYYHDIGKTLRPYFFIENSAEGINPHERLDPQTSARIIISHVSDGVDLAHKYRLPEAIIDFIREHHGTTRVEYFYHQAAQEHPEDLDESEFRYKGPIPQSRETALLMLADGSEATVRSMNPSNQEELSAIVRSVINRRLMSGQLDRSQLTLRDLNLAADAFSRVLQGIHHPRVQYPGEPVRKQRTAPAIAPTTTPQSVASR